ncbi:hypothetical protein [Tenacibaculum soleae]|uniref:hypothetical protein n=1 Tax=Tenacibaculum soleae TaxID=447689 RepID=UPI0026E3D523|nr:hypothetical protein [Tenacibaculum soleae]MDO6813242.1 hypothetical protein [Tenacibaculum soleae]
MRNSLTKFLWREFLNGNFDLINLHPFDIYENCKFTVSMKVLNEFISNFRMRLRDYYIDSQIGNDGSDENYIRITFFIERYFDESKYFKMNKKELSSLIYTFENDICGEKGENFISDPILRATVYIYYLSRFVEVEKFICD